MKKEQSNLYIGLGRNLPGPRIPIISNKTYVILSESKEEFTIPGSEVEKTILNNGLSKEYIKFYGPIDKGGRAI